jgi:hypothetical protein
LDCAVGGGQIIAVHHAGHVRKPGNLEAHTGDTGQKRHHHQQRNRQPVPKRGDRNHRQHKSTGDISGNHDPPMLTTFHPMPDQERKKQVGQHPGRGNRAYLPWSGRQRQRSD